jgi:oligoendopeptidase F
MAYIVERHLSGASDGAPVSSEFGDLPQWNLNDLYPGTGSAEVRDDLQRAQENASQFETSFKGKMRAMLAGGSGGGAVAAVIADYERLEDLLGRLISYAGLIYSQNTTDPQRAKFYGDIQDQITAASSHLLFFQLEMNALDEAELQTAFDDPGLAKYRPWVEDIRKDKPHQLEERVEQLFHEKSVTGRSAWNRLFDETIAALRFQVDGRELAIEATLNLLQDTDDSVRKDAAGALAKSFESRLNTFTLITNTLAKDKEISDRWRGFSGVADSRHLANRVEPEVVDALVAAVHESYPRLSHRYYALKARWMGKSKLAHWDRNAPIQETDSRQIPWARARETVLTAYRGFSPEMADIAQTFFDRDWIDAPVRPGKAPGAFSHPTVPSVHPYVLLNYQGKARDVMTLAHELGHGVHQVLAAPKGALMAPTPLTLAETASVFGEMLTFQSLLDGADGAAARKSFLASKVEDMLNTVVRQIAFSTFEDTVHRRRRDGELTAAQLGEIWLEVQSDSLGPAVDLGQGYETYWTYIPHFVHSPFYVYAYAFGDCLVNALYAVYRDHPDGFVEKYFDMLRAGGTKPHSELLAPFGLDAADPAFWLRGLGVISAMVDELEMLDSEI